MGLDTKTDWLSVAMWLWLWLGESLERAMRRVGGWCEIAASLGIIQLENWVSCGTVASRYELEHVYRKDIVGIRHQTTADEDSRKFSTCCSELQSVWISDSAIVTCIYDLHVFNTYRYPSKRRLQSHSYTREYLCVGLSEYSFLFRTFY
jgi:hypothetical protein